MQLDLFGSLRPAHISQRPSLKLGNGRIIYYTLKRSMRARHVWLKVGIGTGLEVVAPSRMPAAELEDAIRKKSDWIERHLIKMELAPDRPVVRLEDGVRLAYLGGELSLKVTVDTSRAASAGPAGLTLHVSVPDKRPETLKSTVETWYKKAARSYLTERVGALSGGSFSGRISIKDQKTRWGSCSAKGNLNFNWRLVMAPPDVVDYLVIHELAHLDVPDHSVRFWRRVGKGCPDYREKETWLKKNGRGLAFG